MGERRKKEEEDVISLKCDKIKLMKVKLND